MAQSSIDAGSFFATFEAYHESYPAAPLIWVALAVVIVVLALRTRGRADRMIGLFLAALWAWAGIAYHMLSLGPVNSVAYGFGALFVAQGLLFLHTGVVRHRLAFAPTLDARGVLGGILIVYALVVYPMVGLALGHGYPAAPTFGVPCPTTIFTFGILLWASGRVPVWLLAIPVVWAFIGVAAALNWGVWEDLAMPIGALVAAAMILSRNRTHPMSEDERRARDEMSAMAGVG